MSKEKTTPTRTAPVRKIRKFLKAPLLTLATTVALVSLLFPAEAVTIFSDFGAGDDYGTSAFGFSTSFRDIAFSFTIPNNLTPFFIDSIEVPLQGSGSGDGISISIAENKPGGIEPWTTLESSSVYIFGSNAIRTANFSGTTRISSPGLYWIWLQLSSGSSAQWFANNIGTVGNRADSTNLGRSWTSYTSNEATFRINGTVVPEPSSFVLLGTCFIGLLQLRGRSAWALP